MAEGVAAGTPEEYLRNAPAEQADAFRVLYDAVRGALPDAGERIRSGRIVFRVGKKDVVGVSAATDHISLHVISRAAAKALALEFPEYTWSSTTLRLPGDAALPDVVLRRITEYRLAENEHV